MSSEAASQEQGPSLPAPDDLSFEDALEELERTIEQIEEGEIGLEAALAARRRGEALIKRCRSILDRAEQELTHVTPEPSGGSDPPNPDHA